jgi:hypothetical protein
MRSGVRVIFTDHSDAGGIYVINDADIPTMTLKEAKERLLDLFVDYNFISLLGPVACRSSAVKSCAETGKFFP